MMLLSLQVTQLPSWLLGLSFQNELLWEWQDIVGFLKAGKQYKTQEAIKNQVFWPSQPPDLSIS